MQCRRPIPEGEKRSCCFCFPVIHPDALSSGFFAKGRSQKENLKAVLTDLFGHGNENCTLPGQPEAKATAATAAAGGLLFSAAEIDEFNALARECGLPEWNLADFAHA